MGNLLFFTCFHNILQMLPLQLTIGYNFGLPPTNVLFNLFVSHILKLFFVLLLLGLLSVMTIHNISEKGCGRGNKHIYIGNIPFSRFWTKQKSLHHLDCLFYLFFTSFSFSFFFSLYLFFLGSISNFNLKKRVLVAAQCSPPYLRGQNTTGAMMFSVSPSSAACVCPCPPLPACVAVEGSPIIWATIVLLAPRQEPLCAAPSRRNGS